MPFMYETDPSIYVINDAQEHNTNTQALEPKMQFQLMDAQNVTEVRYTGRLGALKTDDLVFVDTCCNCDVHPYIRNVGGHETHTGYTTNVKTRVSQAVTE
jgi:hypothetical protein